MPIVNGQYVSPTWQNGGPPPIDQTELQAMTDTLASLDAVAGGEGRRYARFVVGTSTNGWTRNDCDFLCDGTDDQVEINAAIAAMPSTGGEILLLDGRYNLTANISLFRYITLRGTNRYSVQLARMTTSGYQSTGAMLVASNKSVIKELTYFGNSSLFPSPYSGTMYEVLAGGGGAIDRVDFYSCVSNVIYAEPITVNPTKISNCTFSSIGGSCVYVDYSGELIFCDSFAFATGASLLSAYGQEHDGTPLQSPLSIRMNNVTSIGSSADIILNGTGGSTITNCQCHSVKITNTMPSGTVQPERGRHILLGNQFMPTTYSDTVLEFGTGINNCIAIGNIFSAGSMTGVVENNGTNNIISNGTVSGQVTLSPSGWSSSTQTVSAPGVTANSVAITGPTPFSMSAAMDSGVYCSSQGNGTLTFTCTSTPSSSITYTYTAQEVF